MMKYELAKLFGDVDDRFIEGAKPEAQSAVVLKPTRCSPMKILAAASCAAVVLVGGAVTANVLHNRGMSALEGSNTASILQNNSAVSDEKTGNWFNEEQIYYEGEYYKVPWDSREVYKSSHIRLAALVGLRRPSENTVEIVVALINKSNEPLGIKCYGYDSMVEVKFEPGINHGGNIDYADFMRDKPTGYIIQPGEVCYQKEVFNAECGIYEGEIRYAFGGAYHGIFRVLLTKDGFEDDIDDEPIVKNDEELDLTTDLDGDGIPDMLKERNPDLTDEEWERIRDLLEHAPKD